MIHPYISCHAVIQDCLLCASVYVMNKQNRITDTPSALAMKSRPFQIGTRFLASPLWQCICGLTDCRSMMTMTTTMTTSCTRDN